MIASLVDIFTVKETLMKIPLIIVALVCSSVALYSAEFQEQKQAAQLKQLITQCLQIFNESPVVDPKNIEALIKEFVDIDNPEIIQVLSLAFNQLSEKPANNEINKEATLKILGSLKNLSIVKTALRLVIENVEKGDFNAEQGLVTVGAIIIGQKPEIILDGLRYINDLITLKLQRTDTPGRETFGKLHKGIQDMIRLQISAGAAEKTPIAAATPPPVQERFNAAKLRFERYVHEIQTESGLLDFSKIDNFITELLDSFKLQQRTNLLKEFKEILQQSSFVNSSNAQSVKTIIMKKSNVFEIIAKNYRIIIGVLNTKNPILEQVYAFIGQSLTQIEQNLHDLEPAEKSDEWKAIRAFIKGYLTSKEKPLTDFQRQYLEGLMVYVVNNLELLEQQYHLAAVATSAPATGVAPWQQEPETGRIPVIMTAEGRTMQLLQDIAIIQCEGDAALKAQQRKIIIGYIRNCLETLPKQQMALQAMILRPESRIFVIGDIHSSYEKFLAQVQKMRGTWMF